MQITIAAIGKLKDFALQALYREYKKRLEWKITLHELEAKTFKEQEESSLLGVIPPGTFLISLDEKGENLSSEEFAQCVKTIQIYHQGKLGFIIGGAHGLSEGIIKNSQKSISLGRLTWPHLLVRVLLMEQLYRAQQILKGHPYHRS
jgi:23S rRNA (pseudouridine1915-N3)-methyltransferase